MPGKGACPTPTKTAYAELDAKLAVMRIWAKRRGDNERPTLPRRAYQCPCGWWHLTHRPARPPIGARTP